MLEQKRHSKNKVYSLHDPDVLCIAKGKALRSMSSAEGVCQFDASSGGVIVSAVSFKENLYDGDTLEPALEQASEMTGKTFSSVLVDKGCRGRKNVSGPGGDSGKD